LIARLFVTNFSACGHQVSDVIVSAWAVHAALSLVKRIYTHPTKGSGEAPRRPVRVPR